MSKSIGIDLGTTNSVAAIKRVRTEVLKNAEGEFITPSCVTLGKKRLLSLKPNFVVGRDALEWRKQDPENTILTVKRLMGRSYLDEEIQKAIQERRLTYKLKRHSRGTENSLAIILGGKEYTPEEISSKILEKIKKDAEQSLGDQVEYAVITVPAYFNDKQKHATRAAAALAGLKVRRLLPEPTAAAISFGVDNIGGEDAKTVLVFDFGGGTFDLSVLNISGGQFIEQGKGGDMWLGGEDVDRMLADYVLKETAQEYEIDDFKAMIDAQEDRVKNRFLAELKDAVEKAKIRLSTDKEAFIEILGVLRDADGDLIDVDVELTRDQFNEILAPTVERIVGLTRKVLEDIHFEAELVDNVLLVGGSSQIPRVVAAMEKEFGKEKVLVHERPMLAIAEGAAILSHRLADAYECPVCGKEVSQSEESCPKCGFDLIKHTIEQGVLDIVHTSAHDYYLYLENGRRHLFVEKNMPLPYETTETFALVHPEQRLVHMKFFNVVNEQDESIGDLWLGIEKSELDGENGKVKQEGPLHVEITLRIDENNLIEVDAAIKELREVRVSKTLSRGKADEKLLIDLEETISEANEKGYSGYVMIDIIHRSLSAIKEIHSVVDQETGRIDEAIFKRAVLKIEKARKMAAEDEISMPVIYFAEAALASFGPIIPSEKTDEIHRCIARLKEMDELGTYDENVAALNDLHDALDGLGAINDLMQVQKAGDLCMETEPARAPKFYRTMEEIMEAFMKFDEEKASGLLDGIMPEVMAVLRSYEKKRGVIHKDITK